jgi:hypothetical protein
MNDPTKASRTWLVVWLAGGLALAPACVSTDPPATQEPPANACPEDLEDCGGSCVATDHDPAHCGGCGKPCAEGLVCSLGTCATECLGGSSLCADRCVDTLLDPQHCGGCGKICPPGQVCSGGLCGLDCVGGTKKCATKCVDVTVDGAHCGDCDQACPPALVCSGGLCGVECKGGTTKCGGKCVDAEVDPGNCGDCNVVCGVGEVCTQGVCALKCAGGTAECSGKCVDTKLDALHCGGCGQPCAAGEVCSSGACGLECVGGTTKCGSKCVALDADPKNCGACAKACATGEVCSAETCSLECGGGATKCGTKCVDTLTDPGNCGTCAKSCPSGEVCSNGACALQCSGGATKCGVECVDTQLDPGHCGMCDKACPSGEVCSAGTCALQCVGGSSKCGTKCVDLQSDLSNCGMCAKACASGEVCSNGACASTCGAPLTLCGQTCTNTQHDPQHCGMCNNACAGVTNASVACTEGACGAFVCKQGFGNCDNAAGNGCEVTLATNVDHCGSCGNKCPIPANASPSCTMGTCGLGACNTNYANCDNDPANGCEVNLLTSLQHCGMCNNACGAGKTCSNGTCVDACNLTAVGTPTNHISTGSTYGSWMADPLETLGAGKLWVMDSYIGSTITEYASLAALQGASPTASWTLPDGGWDGTGHVVYGGFLYYNRQNSNSMVKYDIANKVKVLDVVLTGAGFRNTYHYQWGGYSDIDFSVDDKGLWVIYATAGNSGNIVISKLDTANLSVLQSWNTTRQKTNAGNAFMICGVLYVTASYFAASTTIDYKYDTATSMASNPGIGFTNPGGYNSMIHYNHQAKVLYSWDNSRHQTYPLTF